LFWSVGALAYWKKPRPWIQPEFVLSFLYDSSAPALEVPCGDSGKLVFKRVINIYYFYPFFLSRFYTGWRKSPA
jgi:hypothetical protein